MLQEVAHALRLALRDADAEAEGNELDSDDVSVSPLSDYDYGSEVYLPSSGQASLDGGGGEDSGSSSSSSSSSSSDSDASAGGARTAHGPLERKRAAAEPHPDGPPLSRRRRDETFEWRGFRFTFRPGADNKKPSFMALCRYHSRSHVDTKCTRSCSYGDEAERDLVIRRLKTGCVHATDFPYGGSSPNRKPHQDYDKRGLEVLSDEQLEAIELPDFPE